MATAAEIRDTIRDVLALRGTGAIAVVTAMKALGLTSVNRDYLADFLKGKKQSLSFDFSKELADFLEIDVNLLRVKKAGPEPDIRKGARPHLYITEHMEARGWDDAQLADRIDGIAGPETITAWRRNPEALANWQVQALLHAFDMDDIAHLGQLPMTVKKAPVRRKVSKRA